MILSKKNIVFTFFIVFSGLFLHFQELSLYPTSEHSWAQSDHYALALGFLENGFDLFHPTSYTLDHQFPPEKPLETPQGITAADFPIFHYVVALFMKLFDSESPAIFRSISLLWSWIALIILFNAIQKTKDVYSALGICIFIAFQPIYAYYQNGFHISSAAFNTFLIGVSFFIWHEARQRKKYFYWALFFITLASLIRFTHIINLIALLGVFGIDFLKNKKRDYKFVGVLMSILIVLSYFIYNKHLQITYGSVFLNKPLIANSLKVFFTDILIIGRNYFLKFLPITYLIALFILIKFYRKNSINLRLKIDWKVFILISLIGNFIFTCLMSGSLKSHNYYSLDTWMPLLVSFLILVVYSTNFNNLDSHKIRLFIIIFFITSFSYSAINQYTTYKKKYNSDEIIYSFRESQDIINQTIPKGSSILVVAKGGWNTPLIAIKRKAFRHHDNLNPEFSKTILTNKVDYVIIYNQELNESKQENVQKLKETYLLTSKNDYISIWERQN